MATFIPSSEVTHGQLGHGGGGAEPPVRGGGDDGQGDEGSDYVGRLRRARLGVAVAIAAVVMIFVSLTSAYIVRQGLPTFDSPSSSYVRDWGEVSLPLALLIMNTAVLVISSLTMEGARRSIRRQSALAPVTSIPGVSLGEERRVPWLGLTVVLGIGFLAGQFLAWSELRRRGFFIPTNPNSSFVYLFTGVHAVHLAGGVLALLWAGMTSLLDKPVESRRIVIDVTAWYWHFMALLWIYVFALLEFAR